MAPAVRITSPTAAVARALVPAVTKRTTFVFELTISDGSSTQTKVVTVSAAAKAPFTQSSEKQQSGATAATAAKRAAQQAAQQAAEQKRAQSAKQEASAALKQQAKQAANAKTQAKGLLKVNAGGGLVTAYADTEVELRATVTGGDGRHTIKWQQTSGASVTLQGDTSATAKLRAPSTPGYLAFTVTATDADGHTARSAVTVQVEPKGSAPIALNVKIAGAPELIAPAGKPIALVAHTTGGVGKVTYRNTARERHVRGRPRHRPARRERRTGAGDCARRQGYRGNGHRQRRTARRATGHQLRGWSDDGGGARSKGDDRDDGHGWHG